MNGKDNYAGLAKTLADNLEWKYQYERELKEKKEKKMKKELQSKMVYDAWKQYDRDVMLSEYTTIPREHYRHMRNCMVVSLGINLFLLIVMVLR